MRVLAATTAGTGHFQPMVPVLRACVDAGHEVRVACPESYVAHVERAGFSCAPFGEPSPEAMGAVFARLPGLAYEEGNRVVVGEVFAGLDTDAALPALSATVARWRPDVVVRDPAEYASWLVAERAHVGHLRVASGLLTTEASFAPVAAAGLAGAVEACGLPPDPDGRRLVGEPVLSAAPARFDPPDGRVRQAVHRFATASEPEAPVPVPSPEGDEPLVYVSFGTVTASLGMWPAVYRLVVEALADAPVRVLMTTGLGVDPSDLGSLPPRMAVTEFVPQEAVLPHAAVLVTHGGYGTVLGGLRAGVPMVVVPMFADQSYNAARVAATGVGVKVQLSPVPMTLPAGTDAAVRSGVLRLLGDARVRATALEVAGEMAAQPPVGSMVAVVAAAAGG